MVGHGLAAGLYAWAAVLIVASLFRHQPVSPDSVFGAVCGYLLLGMAWGVLYSMLDAGWPGSFAVGTRFAEQARADQSRIHLFTYYSFVTLTTVGYGDVTPVSAPARTCAWLEALTGQFYLAVLVAGRRGVRRRRVVQARRPLAGAARRGEARRPGARHRDDTKAASPAAVHAVGIVSVVRAPMSAIPYARAVFVPGEAASFAGVAGRPPRKNKAFARDKLTS
jgi:Ion channel